MHASRRRCLANALQPEKASVPAVLQHHAGKGLFGFFLGVVVRVVQVEPGATVDHVASDRHQHRLHAHQRRPALVCEHLGADGAAEGDVAGAVGEARANDADVRRLRL